MLNELNKLVELAAQRHASDIHIVCGLPIKCRIDGKITNLVDDIATSEIAESYARCLLGENYGKVSAIGEADVGFTFPCGIRVRGNVYRQKRQISIALRLFSDRIPQIEELGLPECAKNIPELKNGIVLVTGETGSGKSTTIAFPIME